MKNPTSVSLSQRNGTAKPVRPGQPAAFANLAVTREPSRSTLRRQNQQNTGQARYNEPIGASQANSLARPVHQPKSHTNGMSNMPPNVRSHGTTERAKQPNKLQNNIHMGMGMFTNPGGAPKGENNFQKVNNLNYATCNFIYYYYY